MRSTAWACGAGAGKTGAGVHCHRAEGTGRPNYAPYAQLPKNSNAWVPNEIAELNSLPVWEQCIRVRGCAASGGSPRASGRHVQRHAFFGGYRPSCFIQLPCNGAAAGAAARCRPASLRSSGRLQRPPQQQASRPVERPRHVLTLLRLHAEPALLQVELPRGGVVGGHVHVQVLHPPPCRLRRCRLYQHSGDALHPVEGAVSGRGFRSHVVRAVGKAPRRAICSSAAASRTCRRAASATHTLLR